MGHSQLPMFDPRLSALLAAGVLVCGGSLFAAGRAGGKPYQPPAVTVPEVDTRPAEQAQSEVIGARAERKKAEDNLASVVARLKEEFEKSPAVAQALADQKAAMLAYDSSTKPALAKVHETPEYAAVLRAKIADENTITELHQSTGNESRISELAQDAMKQGAAATKLENEAVSQEPAALDAKSKMASTGAAIGRLRAQFNASLPHNADWQAARKALDEAITKLQLAEATNHQESGKLMAAEAARNAAQARKDNQDRSYRQAPATGQKPPNSATGQKN